MKPLPPPVSIPEGTPWERMDYAFRKVLLKREAELKQAREKKRKAS